MASESLALQQHLLTRLKLGRLAPNLGQSERSQLKQAWLALYLVQVDAHATTRRAQELQRFQCRNACAVLCRYQRQPPAVTINALNYYLAWPIRQRSRSHGVSIALRAAIGVHISEHRSQKTDNCLASLAACEKSASV